ncbi:MAG: hypothetical protein AABX83_01890 [Nanoarchaeota archaeon]
MFYGNEEDKRKGKEAEGKFKEWLEKHNIPYIYIGQESETISRIFKNNFSGKRPDFMILIPHFGFIFVDIKYKKLTPPYDTYPIDCNETKDYSSIQRKFNLQVWYVLSNEEYAYKTWFWIPASKVLEFGINEYASSRSQNKFFSISSKDFIQIAEDDSLDRLFSKLYK